MTVKSADLKSAVKNFVLKNFKNVEIDPSQIVSLLPLVSFKRDKRIRNFAVRSALLSDNQRELLNAHAYVSKLILSSKTITRY